MRALALTPALRELTLRYTAGFGKPIAVALAKPLQYFQCAGALVVKIQYVPSLAASVQRLNEGRPSWPNREHVVNLLAAEEGLWSAGGHLDNKR